MIYLATNNLCSQDSHRSLDTGDDHLSRPTSTTSKIFEAKDVDYMKHPTNLIKGKSMPSLRYAPRFMDKVKHTSKYFTS